MGTSDVVTAVLLGLLVVAVGILAFRVSEQSTTGSATPPPPSDEIEEDLVRMLAVIGAASVVLSATGTIVRATPSAYALGIVRSGNLAHAELEDLVAEARRDGGSRQVQLVLPRGPGLGASRLTLHVQVIALTGERVLLLAEDRTAAVRLDATRRDFVANVSHELKTPVGAIALLAETLQEVPDDPEAVRSFGARLGAEARRLSGLVQDIIDLSRLQDADVFLDARRVDVAEVVDEAVERAEVEARARDIAVTQQAAAGLEVFGDHALIVTAVRNLLDNALRYSDGGTRVAVVARPGEGGMVDISVIDQGIGIDADLLPRVFERFYRVDAARSRQTGGTGLGLSIVKHVAADHGGEVMVWSRPGRGSTFTLRLPQAGDETDADPAPPADADPAPPADADRGPATSADSGPAASADPAPPTGAATTEYASGWVVPADVPSAGSPPAGRGEK